MLLQGRYLAGQPVPASYATVNYWGVHGFGFVDANGKKQFGKWIFEPVGGTQSLTDDEAKAKGTDFLIDELRQRVAAGPVAFDFNLQLAQPGDKIDSAVVPLPDDRRKVTLGRLTIKSVAPDSGGPVRDHHLQPAGAAEGRRADRRPDAVRPRRAVCGVAGAAADGGTEAVAHSRSAAAHEAPGGAPGGMAAAVVAEGERARPWARRPVRGRSIA